MITIEAIPQRNILSISRFINYQMELYTNAAAQLCVQSTTYLEH